MLARAPDTRRAAPTRDRARFRVTASADGTEEEEEEEEEEKREEDEEDGGGRRKRRLEQHPGFARAG